MKLEFSPADLAPIIEAAVEQALDRLRAEEATLVPDRLAYLESEAAQLCGLPAHVLRDARLRGGIVGSRVGKRVCYTRNDLIEFLRNKREVR